MPRYQGVFQILGPGDGERPIASGITSFRDAVNRARGIVVTRRGSVWIREHWKGETNQGQEKVAVVHVSGALQAENDRGAVLVSQFSCTGGDLSPSEKKIVEEMMEADEDLTFGEAARRVRGGSLRLGAAVDSRKTLKDILAELDVIADKVYRSRMLIREEIIRRIGDSAGG